LVINIQSIHDARPEKHQVIFCWKVTTCSLINRYHNSTKKAEVLDSFEALVTTYHTTRRKIPEDCNVEGLEESRYRHNTDRKM